MKNFYSLLLLTLCVTFLSAQSIAPFTRVYNTLNQKCQNSSCHSATATDGSQSLKFDGSQSAVYSAVYNVNSSYASSVSKYEKLIKPQHPYFSFLLRKIAGASFDTDLSLDVTGEGSQMLDINGQQLTNKEIEFIRQWIMFGAKQTYGTYDPKPDYQLVSDYYDNPTFSFLTKPAKPAAGTGLQLRMGPIFLPPSGTVEQEWLEQQEVDFPYPVEIDRIAGYMNQQSHHFLLFKFSSTAAATQATSDRNGDMEYISLVAGNTSFDGDKILTGGWQDDAELILPQGTALFWDQHTVLDMDYHTKNYATTGVLPCDFYFNIYFKPRSSSTVEMKTNLVNRTALFLPGNGATTTLDYDDGDNSGPKEIRYIWNMTSHAHKYATDYDIYLRDTTGAITTQLYEGFDDYAHGGVNLGYYSWDHPSTEYFPGLLPVPYGKHNGNKSGLVARTTWTVSQPLGVTFGFTTSDEMQLFYYNYTSQLPAAITAINDNEKHNIYFNVVPNPMNNNGKLLYTLDKAANVEASVTDIAGKVVSVMNSENQHEGIHEINVGATERLSSGIYFAKLSVDGTVYTRKFVVTE